MPIKLKANNGNIDLKVPIKQVGGGAVNSVNGMTGDVVLDIPSKTSQLENDSGFLTEHQSLADYATKDYVSNALTPYAKTENIPDVSGFTTMSAVEAKGYQTAEQVKTIVDTAIAGITDGEAVSY